MSEQWMTPEFVFWMAIVLVVCVPAVAGTWRMMRRDELDAALKHDMIERGMSAAEIEQVLAARTSSSSKK